MEQIVSALKVRRNLGELLNRSCYKGDSFIIQRAGKGIAALVPLEEFRLLSALRRRNFAALNKIWKKTKGIKLTERDIKETIQKVRAGKK